VPDAAGAPALTEAAAASAPPAPRTRPARPRALLVTGLVGLTLFVAFGLTVLQDVDAPLTQPLDDAWRRLVGASALEQVSWVVPMAFQHLGELPGAVLRFSPLFSVDHGSFPSGHAVSAGILLVAVAAVLPPSKRLAWWIVGGLIALGMVWQRTLINAHWFSDAVFGVIGGASATLVLWWAFSTLLAKDYGKPLFRRRIPSPAHEGAS